MTGQSARGESWSRYWASGQLHSCGGSFAGNYDGAIGEFWSSVFAPLGPESRVLDIATGNAALPQLLVTARAADPACLPRIDAVDLAAIQPAWLARLIPPVRERLQVQGGIAAESLPFADHSFDLIVSQYGIEYSALARSAAEVARVRKPGGIVALVLHHQQSLPVRLGRAEVGHIDWLLAAGNVFDRARRLIPYLARLATPAGAASVQRDPEATKVRTRFNESMRALEQRAQAEPAPDLLLEMQAALGQVLAATAETGERAARERMQFLVDGLGEARLRQAELVAHALDRQGVEQLAASLQPASGAAVAIGELRIRDELFGWSLRVG
jgi:SAM-dependent methyltransferase